MAIELGSGYLSLTVSAKGVGKDIAREMGDEITGPLTKEVGDAGQDAGEAFGENFSSDSGSRFGGIATKLGGLLVAGIAGVAAAAGTALAKGVSDAYEAEAANDKLAAQLGVPPDRAVELGAAAGALYRDAYGESLGEVNEAIKRVFQDGLIPEDATNAEIEGVTSRVLDLATAFDQDLGGVTRATSQLIRTGLAADSEEAFDIITRGFQQGADKSEDFLDTLNEYGTQFRKLGIDGETATGLIVQGLQAGARDGDLVADSIKEFSIRAIDGSELTKESFEALGLSAEDMTAAIAAGGPAAEDALGTVLDSLRSVEDPAKRSAIAVGLFGTQAEDMGEALFALDTDTAAKGLGEVGGAAAAMGATLNDNATAKIEAFKRQALGGLADFAARYVIPALERIGTYLQAEVLPRLQQFATYVQDNVIPALASFGQWVMQNVVPALQSIGEWIGTHVVPVLQTLGSFIVDTLVPAIASFAEWLGVQLAPAAQAVADRAAALWPHLQEIGRRIQADVLPALQLMWDQFTANVLPVLKTVAEFIFQQLVPAFIEIQTKIDSYVLPVLARVVTFIGDVIKAQVGLFNALKSIGSNVVDFVRDAKSALDGLIDFIGALPGRVYSLAKGMFDGIKDAFRSAINFVIDGWNGISFSLPSFDTKIPGVGTIGGFSIGTPDIPRLATGGVISRPTLAFLGETSRARPEIVAPQRMMAQTFAAELDARGAGMTIYNEYHGTNLTARDVTAEQAWQLRMLRVPA